MSETLIPPAMLFRLAVPCYHFDGTWTASGAPLGERHIMTSFHAELNLGPRFAELRLGWNAAGVYVDLRTTGKSQAPWCRDTRVDESDGLSLLLDTHNMQDIHRAGRFCHRFVFLPQGAGRLLNEPVAQLVPIRRHARIRERCRDGVKIVSEKRPDGYQLYGFIAAAALTGFDPQEHPALGFNFAIVDRELGWQTFNLGPEFPFLSDPSLWGTLELVR